MVHIPDIQLEALAKKGVVAPVNLGPARDPGLDLMPPPIITTSPGLKDSLLN